MGEFLKEFKDMVSDYRETYKLDRMDERERLRHLNPHLRVPTEAEEAATRAMLPKTRADGAVIHPGHDDYEPYYPPLTDK